MKYVIYENDTSTFAVLIPNCVAHKTTFDMVRHNDLAYRSSGGWFAPVAAGFCTLDPIQCYGESETLNLKSRGAQDAEIVEKLLKSGRYD